MKKAAWTLVLFVSGCLSGVGAAEAAGNVFSNRYVGVSFPVPAGWYVATDRETMQGLQEGGQVMGLDNPALKATMAQMPGKVLLMVSERPFDSAVQTANRNLLIAAISIRNIKNDLSSGADYLNHVARGMRESQRSATVSEITSEQLGGHPFHRLNVVVPIQGITAHMTQLAGVHNDYLVVLNLTADSNAGLAELLQAADRIRLSAVSSQIDGSPEGEAFRTRAALKVQASSGNPLLKNAGLILMIGGVLFFLQGLFRKKR